MPKYRVKYYFDGQGEVLIMAKNKMDAENKFFDGEFDEKEDNEWGENYNINVVELKTK